MCIRDSYIVEDDAAIRELEQYALQSSGYEVLSLIHIFFCSLIKLHAAVHHAVVGAGKGGLSALFYAIHQRVNAAGTIQQAVLCVDVQMDKRP